MGGVRLGSKWSPGRNISRIYRICQLDLDRAFAESGLGKGLYLCLVELARQEGINQKTLAERLVLDQASVTRSVRRLVAMECVDRRDDPEDGRAHRLFLSEKGRGLLVRVRERLDEWDSAAIGNFSAKERNIFADLLKKMELNLMNARD